MSVGLPLSAVDAPIFDSLVVPRYLSWFGELALELFVSGPSARILHVGCRTGYLDSRLLERVERADLLGVDGSLPALELAREGARRFGHENLTYQALESLPGELDPGIFTHAIALHPVLDNDARFALFSALRWLLCSGGQAIVALPLRGSFQEITDLLKEYALKHDDEGFAKRLEAALAERPSLETLSEQLEAAGFEDVDVEVRQISVPFDTGRAFADDPVSRSLILPELRSWLDLEEGSKPLEYVREAVERHWSESKLDLTLNVGAASARCP